MRQIYYLFSALFGINSARNAEINTLNLRIKLLSRSISFQNPLNILPESFIHRNLPDSCMMLVILQ